ncbi:unnamed protein product, partial [Oppiella nova]
VLRSLSDQKKPIFIFEWLRFVEQSLLGAQKVIMGSSVVRVTDIKECQKKLMDQLIAQINEPSGPPTRRLIARCLSTLFTVGDTFLLFEAINKCNDILKNKDDSPSFRPIKLAAITCLGTMYEKLGRLMGRSYEDTVQLLLKSIKSAESQTRCEIYTTLERIVAGMGNAANSVHRDVYKSVKLGMTDRAMIVRSSAAKCLHKMLSCAPFLYTSELENVFSVCFRALEGSNYEVRCSVAQVLGTLVAQTQQPSPHLPQQSSKTVRVVSLDEALNLLASGFLRGGIGFLKSGGEMIKGVTVSRETRVGVTHAYVVVVSVLGSVWLERNMSVFLQHLLDLLANPKAITSHMDAVYSRKCVAFVLRSVLGRQLSEKAQLQAIKELVNVLNRYLNANANENNSDKSNGTSSSATNAKDSAQTDLQLIQHVLVCALLEMGCLIEGLGTSCITVVTDPHVGLVDTIASIVVHPSNCARLSASWCLRCIAVAAPSQLTPLIERSLERLETLKSNPEIINGHSYALSALLGSVCQTPLGIPHNKGKLIFNIAEDLLRSASQNSRLSLQRTQAGWLLIGAVMTLGPPVIKGLLPRLLLLWKNSFPRSPKELESEKARGDAFTWHITLENRAGALSAMTSFLTHCDKLATDEVKRRLLTPIESALTMLAALGPVFKGYGPSVKASSATVRLRLYETLLLIPPQSYSNCYTNLLRLLVSEFTLMESVAITTSSLLRSFCHSDDDTILGSWLQETDHKAIEDQVLNRSFAKSLKLEKEFLQPNTSGFGAIEHDSTHLYKSLPVENTVPGPLPLGVAVIDKSALVFSHVLSENKMSLGNDELKTLMVNLTLHSMSHSNPLLRCASSESLGRCCQVINDGRFVAEMAQQCFDKLKSARDALSRTGHSLALGCIHRYVGGLGSSQHLNTSISILLALAQDMSNATVQVWALHALTLIADSGGPMFRSYVEPTLSHCLKLLLLVPMSYCDVHQCIGKCLSAMITTIGPELQTNTNSICATRSSLLIACAIMQEHDDFMVQAEAIGCLQQLHMFAPKHVNLSSLVPVLCEAIRSPHLMLRRASVACLHQLSQREAKEVSEHVYMWTKDSKNDNFKKLFNSSVVGDHGLSGMLVSMLDYEKDEITVNNIHKIVHSLVQTMGSESLNQWLSLCREVLTAADPNSALPSPDKDMDGDNDELVDVEERFRAGEEPSTHPPISPRWLTRVFTTQTLCRIINSCENASNSDTHFDLSIARDRRGVSAGTEDFLVLHLSDLIRMAFMAATSDSDALRMEGLKALQLIIDKFSKVPEPEFPDHVILEQYQAQVGAALRPAFSADTPSHVTAMACQVCSAWIGSGVARDLNDLRRVNQLLVSSLAKLQKDSSSRLYNESASTIEKLAILKAWAEVYVVSMAQNVTNSEDISDENDKEMDVDSNNESLLQLVAPELPSLSKHWLAALKDHALLTLPTEFSSQLPHDGGAFYTSDTIEIARPRYRASWPPILHAAALWLCSNGFEVNAESNSNEERFHLLFGICLEALCNPKSTEPLSYVVVCLKSLQQLICHPFPETLLGKDKQLSIELCNVLHRLLLTRETPECQLLILNIAQIVTQSQLKYLDNEKKRKLRELAPANQEPEDSDKALATLGEGGESGDIIPGQSLVYALLEVGLCVLVRQLPQLSPMLANTPGLSLIVPKSSNSRLTKDSAELIGRALHILCDLPLLCSPKGSTVILPSILYLVTGVLRESATQPNGESIADNQPISTVLSCLRSLGSSSLAKNSICGQKWTELLQSTLAVILDLCKTSDSDEPKPDEITTLLAVGIFIIKAPSDVVQVPNLQYPAINLLKQSLQSDKKVVGFKVQLKCIQTIRAIFEHSNSKVSVPYIHILAPRMIEVLNNLVKYIKTNDIISQMECEIVLELFQTLEVLIEMAQQDKKANILIIYLPLLVTLLSDESMSRIRGYRRNLHNYALQKLTAIGPKYPHEFRQVIGSVPKFRNSLENAIRNQQQMSEHSVQNSSQNVSQKENPTIKLKVDFSNYTDN